MKTQSAKAKGRRLQKTVVKIILDNFNHLSERDVQSTSMGATGADIKLSKEAFECFPTSIECKNQEANKKLLTDFQQAAAHSVGGTNGLPLLVISANHSDTLMVMRLEDLFKLIWHIKGTHRIV